MLTCEPRYPRFTLADRFRSVDLTGTRKPLQDQRLTLAGQGRIWAARCLHGIHADRLVVLLNGFALEHVGAGLQLTEGQLLNLQLPKARNRLAPVGDAGLLDAKRPGKIRRGAEVFDSVLRKHEKIIGTPNREVNRYPLRGAAYSRAMLGERIKALRVAQGLSGAALAKKCGIKAPSLWEIENNETKSLKADTLMALARHLKTNATYIWTGVGHLSENLDPNAEEAEAAALYRQLRPENRVAWMAAGHALRQTQPPSKPTVDDPFIKVKRSVKGSK